MTDYLTYEEMMVSSLIGVSGYTSYINDGSRHNRGNPQKQEDVQPEGVQIGLVGARFEREARMDSVYYEEDQRESLNPKTFPFALYFAGDSFEMRWKARIRITIETLLLEADRRGLEAGKSVYLHVVGLGLGVWAIDQNQARWYIEVFTQSLTELNMHKLGVLEFAYINVDSATRENVERAARKRNIQCVFNHRAPSARLTDSSLLLVVSYAWDGNAYPGNEYYCGFLDSSGDPAAACSSAISETHNPEINTDMLKAVFYLERAG